MRREHAASVTTPCTSPMNAASKHDLRGVTSRRQPLTRLTTILAIATTTYAAETAIRLGTREAFPSLHPADHSPPIHSSYRAAGTSVP